MRRPGVRIPSRPPSSKRPRACQKSYRGTLGLSSLSDSFRYLVIHAERHCVCAASSVITSRQVTTALRLARKVRQSDTLQMLRVVNHVPGVFCWIELATTDQTSAKKFYFELVGWV